MSKTQTTQQNGTAPKTITLDLNENEFGLIYQMLQQGQFPEAVAKMVAAGLQQKLEQQVQAMQELA